MEYLINGLIDFVRVRQLNIALAAVLTIIYLVYQYKDVLFKMRDEPAWQNSSRRSRSRLSRSRSRSRSRSKARAYPLRDSNTRRGRRPTRRCQHCSQCNINTDI